MEPRNFEPVSASEELRPWVRRYLYANRMLRSDLTIHAKPTGYSYFSNFFGVNGGDGGVINGRAFDRVSRWFLYGQTSDHDVYFHHRRALQLIVTELSATAHHRLFGIPGHRILGLAAEFEDVAPDQALIAREFFTLGPEAARDDHVREADGFFLRLAENALPADPVIEEAVRLFEMENGAVRIADLCGQLGVASRELNRRFRDVVGVSPKFFGQVMQINWVIGLLYSDDRAKLAQIALDAGFYDQAHFNRAMQRFFQEGPREFLRSDHPAFRSFLAASRRFGPASPAG